MATRKAICLVSGLFEEVNTPTDKLDFAGNSTTDLGEGTNLYFTNTRARAAISVTDAGGDGSLGYDNSTGVITYTGPSASEVRAHFSVAAGSGLTYSSSTGEFGTSAIPNSQLANSSITLGSTSVSLGATATTLTGFVSLTSTTVNATNFHAPSDGAANSISISSGNILFEGSTADANEIALTAANASADRTITLPDATGTVALLESLSAANSGTGFGSLAYTSATGTFTYTKVTATDIRGQISVTDSGGDGSLAYDNSTGVITYTGPSASEVRAHFTVAVGSGLTYNSSTGQFGTSAIPNAQLANSSITIGSTGIALGSSSTTLAGLTSVTSTGITTNDSGFRIRNTTDITKQIAFDASVISTATTRTYTLPDANGTLVLTSTLPTTFSDSTFRVQDNGDATKQLAFECSGITTSTTRTMTVPDENGTISTQDFATAIAIALG